MSSGPDAVDTGRLYDEHATRWQRREPSSLSDFTGRPAVFDLCGDVAGLELIDLGSGEGYCSPSEKGMKLPTRSKPGSYRPRSGCRKSRFT